jgi:hypothetical protein
MTGAQQPPDLVESDDLALGFLPQPHIIACAYDDAAVSKEIYAEFVEKSSRSCTIFRIQAPPGRHVVACCADDEPAASYCARLPWGAGTPTQLSDEVCAALVERRRDGELRARKTRDQLFESKDLNLGVHAPDLPSLNQSITQLKAMNTDQQTWAASGGICGALCASYADAAHVREIIVSGELHDSWEGLITAFGGDESAVVAGVCDTRETCEVAAEAIARLAGNLDFVPDSTQAWTLWALRLTAGTSPLPITVDGTAKDAQDFLKGSVSPRAKLLKPSRNQPCICGSGKKYKHCCGR